MAEAHTGNGSQYEDIIQRAAAKNKLDPNLIKAVIRQESGFNNFAQSGAGAQGLMQIMPLHGLKNPFDPEENIMYGTSYLKKQIDRFGSIELGLAAYNAGPGNVAKYGDIPPFQETQNYVKKIMAAFTGVAPLPGTEAGPPKTSYAGSVIFGVIRAALIILLLVAGLLFILKAFPVTSQVVDLADPMKKVKVLKKVVKATKGAK